MEDLKDEIFGNPPSVANFDIKLEVVVPVSDFKRAKDSINERLCTNKIRNEPI